MLEVIAAKFPPLFPHKKLAYATTTATLLPETDITSVPSRNDLLDGVTPSPSGLPSRALQRLTKFYSRL
jgi:hypothetical protein